MKFSTLLFLFFILQACQAPQTELKPEFQTTEKDSLSEPKRDTALEAALEAARLQAAQDSAARAELLKQSDTTWADLRLLLPQALFEIRYASTDNFMKTKVYACEACYLRLGVAKALMKAQGQLDSLGLRFKFFDCYRPASAQEALWKVTPDARYVTPPKRGSMHSRGMAVDLSLCDAQGRELDMGTPFDFFGERAYWRSTPKHTAEVQKNRRILRSTMESVGFNTVTTEWWHYNYRRARFNLSDWRWACS